MPASYVVTNPPTQINGQTRQTASTTSRCSARAGGASFASLGICADIARLTILPLIPCKDLFGSDRTSHAAARPEDRSGNHPRIAEQHHQTDPQYQAEDCADRSKVVFAHHDPSRLTAEFAVCASHCQRHLSGNELNVMHQVPQLGRGEAFSVLLLDHHHRRHWRT